MDKKTYRTVFFTCFDQLDTIDSEMKRMEEAADVLFEDFGGIPRIIELKNGPIKCIVDLFESDVSDLLDGYLEHELFDTKDKPFWVQINRRDFYIKDRNDLFELFWFMGEDYDLA